MAFPQVLSVTETLFAADTDPWPIDMPAVVTPNDLLVLLAAMDGPPTFQSLPSGFTELASNAGVQVVTWIGAKVAVGNEGGTTVTLNPSAAERGGAQVYRIAGWQGSLGTGLAISAVSAAATTTPDPPSLDPAEWDVEDTLWLVLLAVACTTSGNDVSSYPTSYTNGVKTGTFAGSVDAFVASARRENAVVSEDPGTFSLSGSAATSRVWTLAVRPGTSGGGGTIERTILRLSSSSSLIDS